MRSQFRARDQFHDAQRPHKFPDDGDRAVFAVIEIAA